MEYAYFIVPNEAKLAYAMRKALFERMQEEGLLPFTMHAYVNPRLEDWLNITQEHKGHILCCVQKGSAWDDVRQIRAMAWISPWQGRVWTFDFTVFRAHFTEAAAMSRGALQWIFSHLPCDSVLGISAQSNRHAWRLAQAAGFEVLGKVPGACYKARNYSYEDGVLVQATRQAHGLY